MPKTWEATLEGHRQAVRTTVTEAALALALELGFHKVSMTDVATRAGITRATLYKYFPDVDSIFVEWHRRTIARHLANIHDVVKSAGHPASRLAAVLETYAFTVFRHHGTRFAEFLHRGDHTKSAEIHLVQLIEDVIAEGADAGRIRRDLPPSELAIFCYSSLSSVHRLDDEEGVRRMISLVMDALRAPSRLDAK